MEKCYWATHGYTKKRTHIHMRAHISVKFDLYWAEWHEGVKWLFIYIYNYIYIELYIYIYLENRMFFFVHYGFYQQRTFFVQLRILFFDCEGLFKSFDNTGFGHPPTVSKGEFQSKVEQIGSCDRAPTGTHFWPQILPYFLPNLDVPIKYQYFFNIMLKKNSNQMSTYCPKYCL